MKTLVLMAITLCGLSAAMCPAFAQTWTQTSAPTNYWISIAGSADGSKLFACGQSSATPLKPQPIYFSTDGGATWTLSGAPSNYWNSIASSADGMKIIAGVDGSGAGEDGFFLSNDGGLTWTSNNIIPVKKWVSVASSADGSHLFALNSDLYTSTNFGATWYSPATGINSVATSADGTKLIVATLNNYVCTSTNTGKSWLTNVYVNPPFSVASSADGNVLAVISGAGGPAGRILISTNAGAAWVTNNTSGYAGFRIAVSANGSKIIVAGLVSSGLLYGPIYTSTNAGSTWISNNIPRSTWYGVYCSADGNKQMAVSSGTNLASIGLGHIWISQTTPPPQLNLASSNNNLAFSWLIPSTNCVLQQSSDLISWTSVTDAPALNFTNLNYELTISPSNSSGFFRLMAQ